jgi:succinoglycan biosynthesis protein ExoA
MISVICPVYNEAGYIKSLLDFFLRAEPAEKEFILVDGGSTDGTRAIISNYSECHANIRLIDNPERYVPYALNRAIQQAKGTIIIRLDAHSEYADDYFIKTLETFADTDAAIIGGPMRAIGKTSFQMAVAHATSTRMGIGNSNFHFDSYKGYTDSVYLGAWKRSLFDDTGLFDEQMKRNQDDEFHYRARSRGFRIYQNPDICSLYFPRSTAAKLFRQYYEYGLYKPLVLKKIKSEIKVRHLIPALFVIYLLSAGMVHKMWYLLPLAFYIAAALFFSMQQRASLRVKCQTFACYFILHVAYGSGFLAGLFKAIRRPAVSTPMLVHQAV